FGPVPATQPQAAGTNDAPPTRPQPTGGPTRRTPSSLPSELYRPRNRSPRTSGPELPDPSLDLRPVGALEVAEEEGAGGGVLDVEVADRDLGLVAAGLEGVDVLRVEVGEAGAELVVVL